MKTILFAIVAMLVAMGDGALRQIQESKDFQLDEVVPNTFSQRGFNGSWLSDKEFIYRNSNGDYVKYNVESQSETVVLKAGTLAKWSGVSVTFISPDVDKALIRYATKKIFRHSTLSKFVVLDINSGNTYDVANAEDISVCIVSPNGQSLVYVKDNNVYYRAEILSTSEIPLTTDGVPGIIYNGAPDWVYEEKVFGMDSTLWFSADGSHLAMASFDDTDVKESSYYIYDDPHDPEFQYPKEYKVRYPKVNTTNPTVHLRVMNLADTTKWHELSAPEITVSDDHILGAVNWIGNDLGAMWLRRSQTGVTYQRCNVEAQVCRQMIAVNEENGWYVLNTPRCTKSGDRCFLLANVNGWQRIWELNGGDNIVYKSPEKYTVTSINGYDEFKDHLYYTAVPASAPQTRHVYRNGDCLTCSLKDKFSNNDPCNYASISFSTDFSYFAATCSGPTPSYTQIYRTEGQELIADWETNEQLRTKLAPYKETQVRFLKVPVHRRFKASVRLYLPPEIDFENPDNNQATYPMIVQVYGAPNSAQVIDTFTVGFGNYLTTTKKTILCQIDGRGTANQGYDFLFSIKNRLGTVDVNDQIAVTRHLQKTYSFIDRNRTGIWGWGYGGYVTSMALGKDYDCVFKCGISVAPITSWMFYDSIYTERYMGLPLPEDNEGGYEISDTMWQHVARIKNHMFLLIRGNVDDKNSMVFVRALEDGDENLEQMQFPDEDDGLGGVRQHLYHKMDNFWNQCFA